MPFAPAKAVAVETFERRYLESVLTRTRGNVTLAASLAGTERRALGKMLKKHHIDRLRFARGA
jgi:DNA-binding protein Fis